MTHLAVKVILSEILLELKSNPHVQYYDVSGLFEKLEDVFDTFENKFESGYSIYSSLMMSLFAVKTRYIHCWHVQSAK